MADYSVTFARSARKELEKLPLPVARRVIKLIEALAKAPRPPGVIRLQGNKNLWRIRIGDYRVIYSIDDAARVIDISVVRHRRDAYRQL
jgi:mRNA interferase RelE/StbE